MTTVNQSKMRIFNDIQIGRKFKTASNIIYQKISTKQAKPIQDSSGNLIANGRVSNAFFNSKVKLIITT